MPSYPFVYLGKKSALNELQGHENRGKLECRSAECNRGSWSCSELKKTPPADEGH